ncbi:MAG: hypothetical protein HKL85_03965, partial [Acidimicrobiaceae bacterium]|nr:hypothetical protein [Acidimicrobiaceae bacterium]
MAFNPRKFLSTHRNKVMPALLSASLLGGVIATISMSTNATADYVVGCQYGYGSTGTTFGLGTGYGYGYLNGGGQLTYGYGNQVCPITITPSTLATGTVGSFYSQTLTTTYPLVSPVDWALANNTSLPAGLSLSTSGVISGTPGAAITAASFAVTVKDGNGELSQPVLFSITINPAATTTTTTPATTTTVPATTTTVPATTTTLPATTTTVASPQAPVFQTVSGRPAYVGETRLFVIHGLRLSGLTVSSNGAVLRIVSDSATLLKVDVTPIYGRKAGGYPLTGRNAYGSTSFRYS